MNAHGTSTPLGDLAETRALNQVFGEHAYGLAVSSTKSVSGHCFGAAGALEAMMCALALRDGRASADHQLPHARPGVDLDYVPNEARRAEVDVALSNAMGLGGHNACVLLGREADGPRTGRWVLMFRGRLGENGGDGRGEVATAVDRDAVPGATVCRHCAAPLQLTMVDLGKSPLCQTVLADDELERGRRSIRST